MDNTVKEKLSKIYELVNQGATEGERNAAKAALERMLAKYNLTAEALDTLAIRTYLIKYSNINELYLLNAICNVLFGGLSQAYRRTLKKNPDGALVRVREYVFNLNYLDFVQVSCSFEYFKRHMKAEFKRVVKPLLKRYKSAKTRAKLNQEFLSQYIIASKLYREQDIEEVKLSGNAAKRRRMLDGVEGGSFNTQIQSSHLLNG